MINGVDDSILSNAQTEQIIVPLELFNILTVWQQLDCGDDSLFLVEWQSINKFLCFLLDDDSIHQSIPHSRLQSSSE